MKTTNWKNLMELKKTYQQADGGVKSIYTVFNLGNEYRLVTLIDYEEGIVTIVDGFTHEQYDHWNKTK